MNFVWKRKQTIYLPNIGTGLSQTRNTTNCQYQVPYVREDFELLYSFFCIQGIAANVRCLSMIIAVASLAMFVDVVVGREPIWIRCNAYERRSQEWRMENQEIDLWQWPSHWRVVESQHRTLVDFCCMPLINISGAFPPSTHTLREGSLRAIYGQLLCVVAAIHAIQIRQTIRNR